MSIKVTVVCPTKTFETIMPNLSEVQKILDRHLSVPYLVLGSLYVPSHKVEGITVEELEEETPKKDKK